MENGEFYLSLDFQFFTKLQFHY